MAAHPTRSILIAVAAVAAALLLAVTVALGGGGSARRADRHAPAPAAVLRPIDPSASTADQVKHYAAEARAHPSADAYVKLALAELQMAREDANPSWYTRAEALLRKARTLDPGNPTAVAALGSIAAARHDFVRALGLARRSLRMAPGNAYAGGVAVDALVELGRYPQARAALQRMLDRRPDLSSYARASYILELDGRTALARRALRQAILSGAPVAENTAWAYLYLGNLEFGRGRYAAAGRAYRMAERVDPGFVHARAAMARLAAARGDVEAGIRLLRPVVAQIPLPAYVIALGDMLSAAGRPAAARKQYSLARLQEQLYIANGVNVDVELATFEVDHGGDARAAVARLRELRRTQRSVVVDDALGWALLRAGAPRQALVFAQRALRLGTRDATFLFHRGAIEAALGRRSEAARDLRAALTLNPHFSILHEAQARRLLEEVTR
jgi:tetratricopeptide (TPR) repeat protein